MQKENKKKKNLIQTEIKQSDLDGQMLMVIYDDKEQDIGMAE